MKRAPAAALVIAGLCLLVLGFGYDLVFAGLPYQDPTPQMQAEWTRHKTVASVIESMGFGLVFVGASVALVRWVRGRLRG